MEDTFSSRANALENSFFSQVDAKLNEQLAKQLAADKTAEELGVLSGIEDKATLRALVEAGVTGRSLTAMRVFPLVAVAWADGMLQEAERDKILEIAENQGLPAKTPAGSLLGQWLQHPPTEETFAAWEAYTSALLLRLSGEEANSLRESIAQEINAIAQAAGGVLGWSAVSRNETATMKRIRAVLDRAAA